jgi:hypothetical protein
MFPAGPKYVIQRKTKFDSLYGTKIAQNISPGPGYYQIKRNTGGTHQTIAIRFKQLLNKRSSVSTGPGSYNVSIHNTLKKEPSAVFGTTSRNFTQTKTYGPDPTTYSHQVADVTSRKSNSRERNTARATIGRALRDPVKIVDNIRNPGPQSYNTFNKRIMGDASSVKISFPMA